MKHKKECEQTRKLCDELTRCGAICISLQAGMFTSGWPDRLVWHKNWRGFLEMKRHDGQLSARQRKNLQDLWRRCPGSCFVVWFPEPGKNLCTLTTYDGTVRGGFTTAEYLLDLLLVLGDNPPDLS